MSFPNDGLESRPLETIGLTVYRRAELSQVRSGTGRNAAVTRCHWRWLNGK